MDEARYRTLYLAPLPAGPRARGLPDALPAFDDRHFFLKEGEVEVVPLSLPQLFTAGVECGHTAARVELKHQIGTVSAQLEHLREHFRAVQDRAKGDREQLAGELLATQRKFHSAQLQVSEMQVQAGQMQMQAEQMQSHAAHLETSLSGARHRIDELESSTCVADDGADAQRRPPAQDRARAVPRMARGRGPAAAAVGVGVLDPAA